MSLGGKEKGYTLTDTDALDRGRARAPRFSVITPVHDTPAAALKRMVRSVRRQTFQDWELCLVDDASTSPHISQLLSKAGKDRRIHSTRRATHGGVVATSNDALAAARGEFVVLLGSQDELHPEALQQVDAALTKQPDTDYLYTDEDRIDEAGNHCQPFFKPGWSPERLRTQMYTRHLSVLRRSLVDEVGRFRDHYEGSEDWDLVLRVTERARHVEHIAQILYHSHTVPGSTSSSAGAHASPSGPEVVQSHCERVGLAAVVSRHPDDPHLNWLAPRLAEHPLVSIIIPTSGATREVRAEPLLLVTRCVKSIVHRSTYENYEIICVVDDDTDPAVVKELDRIDKRVKTLRYSGSSGTPARINTGVLASSGEHLILLHDDLELIVPDWIERLLMYSRLDGVGAVGAQLIYSDGRLHHSGLLVRDGRPHQLFHGFPGNFAGYFGAARVAANYLAVSRACLMTSRQTFDSVGGLSPEFPGNLSDVDYCLKLRHLGLRVAYDAGTKLYHYPTSDRPSVAADWELQRLTQRWSRWALTDPNDNPNLDRRTPHMVPPVLSPLGAIVG